MTIDSLTLVPDPYFPWSWLLAGLLVALVPIGIGLWNRRSGTICRLIVLMLLFALLVNPSIVQEERSGRPDIAVVVVDDSGSQMVGDRPQVTANARAHVLAALAEMTDLEVREARAGAGRSPVDRAAQGRGTRLLGAIASATADVPDRALAGVIVISDGQVHDADRLLDDLPVPTHVILTGRRSEIDRRLVLQQAPNFGMVGRSIGLRVMVEDSSATRAVPISVRVDGEAHSEWLVEPNQPHTVPVLLDRAGETIVEVVAAKRDGELSTLNNRVVHSVNGIRDRLRVLLVSGAPAAGERTWRDILKSDPSVDLIHFTILRPPEKQDGTPVQELSLIPFPIMELFEVRLSEFDLIVFDRYRRRGLLARRYLENIANFVREGGALLEASGPAFSGQFSLIRTPLGSILPGTPTGQVSEGLFRPRLTDLGARHPVTASLPGSDAFDRSGQRESEASWGRWLRLIDAQATSGTVLIEDPEQRPVLILDRVGEGRIAHLLSDHIWLWNRGFDGGGPHTELLRRVAHWLMKEPELEERDLVVSVNGTDIAVTQRSMDDSGDLVIMTRPDGSQETARASIIGPGRKTAQFTSDQIGLHRFSDGHAVRLAAVGALNPVEFADLRSTAAILGPMAGQTGGGLYWAAEDGLPELRRVRAGRSTTGRGWIGIRENRDYVVTGSTVVPLLPPLLALLLVAGTAILAWRREGA